MQLNRKIVKKRFSTRVDALRFFASATILLLVCPIAIINIIFVFSTGFPSFFGKGYYLSRDKDANFYDCTILTVDTNLDYGVGDKVIYAYKKGYATGIVNNKSDYEGKEYVVVKDADSVSVLKSDMVVGVATGKVPFVGTVVAFLYKYRISVQIICALVAIFEIFECFASDTNKNKDFLK